MVVVGARRRDWMRVRNLVALKVKAAPRRKWATSGFGMAESSARVRW